MSSSLAGPWRKLDVLAVLLPAAVAADLLGASAAIRFVLGALAVVPLAGLVGRSTEVLAENVGGSMGALLNATFGNVAELVLAALLVLHGEITILRASITGSIVGNLLLLLGVAMIVATHDKREMAITRTSRVQSTMLFLSVAVLVLPAVYSYRPGSSTSHVNDVSDVIALVLFCVYALSLVFMLRTNRDLFRTEAPAGGQGSGHESSAGVDVEKAEGGKAAWSVKEAVAVLVVATALVAVAADLVAGSVQQAGASLGLHSGFIGFVILPVVGNAAEQFSALALAAKDKLGVASEIAVGSSMQLAMLVVPLLVLLGALSGHPVALAFSPLELTALAAGTLLARQLLADGLANWLEGVMLLGLYLAFAGAVFFANL